MSEHLDDRSIDSDQGFSEAFGNLVQEDPPPKRTSPPAEPEPAPAASPAESEAPKLLGRFDDPEQLAKSYKELEVTLGRQADEIGKLRQMVETSTHQQQTPPPVQIDAGTVDWFDDQVEQNPAGAATWALQNDQTGVLYQRAMDYWHETNPRQAMHFEFELNRRSLMAEQEQRMAPLMAQANQNEFALAYANLRSRFPDIDQYSTAIAELGRGDQYATAILQSGGREAKEQVIENLYARAKLREAGQPVPPPSVEVTSAQHQEALRQAHVASPSTATIPVENGRLNEWLKKTFLEPEPSSFARGFKPE